jgi:hypothetical protein
MSYKIDPDSYCTEDGCTRPKATGEQVCSQCQRLSRAMGRIEVSGDNSLSPREVPDQVTEFRGQERRPPRCVAYLSLAGDVITLELTGEPKFTEADVEAVAAVLSNLKKAA